MPLEQGWALCWWFVFQSSGLEEASLSGYPTLEGRVSPRKGFEVVTLSFGSKQGCRQSPFRAKEHHEEHTRVIRVSIMP